MVPGRHGGTFIIYNKVLKPFFLKHQDSIDRTLNQAKDSFGKGKLFINNVN